MTIRQITTTVAACLWASTSLADDAALPEPTIKADVRGFQIGMSSDEVLAHLASEYPDAQPRLQTGGHPNSGQKFVYSITAYAGDELLRFYFTGHFSGNRLFAMQREAKFKQGNRPYARETRDDLVVKYGLPTFAGGHTLTYNYNADDVVLWGTEDQIRPLLNADLWDGYAFGDLAKASGNDVGWQLEQWKCHEAIKLIQTPNQYSPLNPNLPLKDDCMAAMTVRTDTVDGLLATLHFNLGDYRFVVASARIDQHNDVRPAAAASDEEPKL